MCGKCPEGYPLSIWDKMPEGCGFEGWLFQKKEEIKQKIRKQKELLLSLEVMVKTVTPEQAEKLSESIKKIKKTIESYAKYGSENW